MKRGCWIKNEDGTRTPGVIGKDGIARPIDEKKPNKQKASAKPADKEK